MSRGLLSVEICFIFSAFRLCIFAAVHIWHIRYYRSDAHFVFILILFVFIFVFILILVFNLLFFGDKSVDLLECWV